jgi:hypothetical protein
MTGQTWHLAITDGGVLADGHLGSYPTATEAAETMLATLTLIIGKLREWAAAADPGDPLMAHAQEIADRLIAETQQLQQPWTDQQYEEILDDPNVADIPLNTLSLPEDTRHDREPYVDTPIPFAGRWSERSLSLQTWATPTRPGATARTRPAMHTPPPARHIPVLNRLRQEQP